MFCKCEFHLTNGHGHIDQHSMVSIEIGESRDCMII